MPGRTRPKSKPGEKAREAGAAKAARSRRPSLSSLEEKLSYTFKDKELLKRALTHASALMAKQPAAASNERLEFLGDRVLGLLIADALARSFPVAAEGELAVRLNDLVRQKTLCDIATRMELGDYLVMSAGEARAGGRSKPAILADACEALIAALYLDGGLEAAGAFVKAKWGRRLAARVKLPRDAKTALQEWAQGQGSKALPQYELLSRSGPDHVPAFDVEVRVAKLEPCVGSGGSKRAAEQAAAWAMLIREGVWKADE